MGQAVMPCTSSQCFLFHVSTHNTPLIPGKHTAAAEDLQTDNSDTCALPNPASLFRKLGTEVPHQSWRQEHPLFWSVSCSVCDSCVPSLAEVFFGALLLLKVAIPRPACASLPP